MINKKDVLKLEGLMYLYALSKKGSKREVADILNVSVDTVNKYITDLEDEFKVKLLSSNGRGTILTSEGQRLLASAVDLVNVIRHVNNYADDIIHPRGEVRILLTDIAADYLYNHNFFGILDQYPEIRLSMSVSDKKANRENTEYDLCLSYEPPSASDSLVLKVKKIFCGIFASVGYIKKYGEPENMEDLFANHRICDKSSHVIYIPGWTEKMLKANKLALVSDSLYSFRYTIEKGIGIGVCPLYYGYKGLQRLKNIHFKFALPVYLSVHKTTMDTPRVNVVLECLIKAFNADKYAED